MANKLKYFIGNWKMYGSPKSLNVLLRVNRFLSKNRNIRKNTKIIFCVPYTLINNFSKKIQNKLVKIGAQNCHHDEKIAAHTGSINAIMVKKSGANFIILGHSDNRNEGDTNFIINKKIASAIKQNLNVIFCIGENAKEKKAKRTLAVLKKQIKESLYKKFKNKKIIIAYEPVWSIGTGKTPKLHDLKNIVSFIKSEYKKIYKNENTPVLFYGGSVNAKNVTLFSTIKEIDGFLIGGASQSSKNFIDIIKNYYK